MNKTINYTYKAFVSYCHKDTKYANKIMEALSQNKTYQVAKTLQPIFKDKSTVPLGQILSQITIDELKDSAALVVLCSIHSIENQDVNEEIRIFKMMGREKDILPIIIDPLGVLETQDLMPQALRYKVNGQGKVTSEVDPNIRLYDVRKHNPGLFADLESISKEEAPHSDQQKAKAQQARADLSERSNSREITPVVEVKPVVSEVNAQRQTEVSREQVVETEPVVTHEYRQPERPLRSEQQVRPERHEPKPENIKTVVTRDAKDVQARAKFDVVDLNPIKRIVNSPWFRNVYVISLATCLVWSAVFVGGYFLFQKKSPTRIDDNILPLMVRYAASGQDISQLPGAAKGLKQAFASIYELSDKWPRYKEVYRLLKGGQPRQAEILLKDVANSKLGTEASEVVAQAFRNYAAILSLRNVREATVPFAQAATLDPQHVPGMFWHGWLQMTYGSREEGRRAFNQVMAGERRPENNWYINNARLSLWDIERGQQRQVAKVEPKPDEKAAELKRKKAAEKKRRQEQNEEALKLEEGADGWKAIGNIEEAIKQYNFALKIRYTLAQAEPNKKEWQLAIYFLQSKLAALMIDQGDLTGAVARHNASLNVIDKLLTKERENKVLQAYQVETYQKIAQIKMVNREHNEALRLFTKALIITRPIAETTNDKLWSKRQANLKKQIALLNVILSSQKQ